MMNDRLPPQNLEAERGVIGSILLDNTVLHELVAFLGADDFYRDSHRIIYGRIREMYDGETAIDLITLAEALTLADEFDRIGGDDALADILNTVPHAANALHYAQIVRQKSISRQVIAAANEMLREGYSGNFTAEQLLESAESRIFAIAEQRTGGALVDGVSAMGMGMAQIQQFQDGQGTGIPTGFYDLDVFIGGLRNQSLTIIGARPSMGKTGIALKILEHVVLHEQQPVLLISLEMEARDIAVRLATSYARVNNERVTRRDGLMVDEFGRIATAHHVFEQAVWAVDPGPIRTVTQIAAVARRQKHGEGLALLIVDYIQLVAPDDDRELRQEQIAKISRKLKILAKELDLPVIALSQLNRAAENREDKRPRMADLRESGAIEQDADLVLLLHRPEYYDLNDQPGIAELIVAKNRNGATGLVKLSFIKECARFENHLAIANTGTDRPF